MINWGQKRETDWWKKYSISKKIKIRLTELISWESLSERFVKINTRKIALFLTSGKDITEKISTFKVIDTTD